MYKYLVGLCLVALTGCMSVPNVSGVQGTISCGSLETLTAKTTIVYVYSTLPGTYSSDPDCKIKIEIK